MIVLFGSLYEAFAIDLHVRSIKIQVDRPGLSGLRRKRVPPLTRFIDHSIAAESSPSSKPWIAIRVQSPVPVRNRAAKNNVSLFI
jgi:hypothetical protein